MTAEEFLTLCKDDVNLNALTPDLPGRGDGKVIEVEGDVILGDTTLKEVSIQDVNFCGAFWWQGIRAESLSFSGCTFAGGFDIRNSVITKEITFQDCTFLGHIRVDATECAELRMWFTTVKGPALLLNMPGVQWIALKQCEFARMWIAGDIQEELSLWGCKVTGPFFLFPPGGEAGSEMEVKVLLLDRCNFLDDIDLSRVRVHEFLGLMGSTVEGELGISSSYESQQRSLRVEGDVRISDAQFSHPLRLDGINVGGSLSVSNMSVPSFHLGRREADSKDANSCLIGGNLEISHVVIEHGFDVHCESLGGLSLRHSEIAGDCSIGSGSKQVLRITGGVTIGHSKFGGGLTLRGVKIAAGDKIVATNFVLMFCSVEGDVLLGNEDGRVEVRGNLSLRHCEIKGAVISRILSDPPERMAPTDADMEDGVRFLRVKIGGELHMGGRDWESTTLKKSFFGYGITVDGDASFGGSIGENFRLVSSEIHGKFRLDATTIPTQKPSGPTPTKLLMQNTSVSGEAVLQPRLSRDTCIQRCQFKGELRLEDKEPRLVDLGAGKVVFEDSEAHTIKVEVACNPLRLERTKCELIEFKHSAGASTEKVQVAGFDFKRFESKGKSYLEILGEQAEFDAEDWFRYEALLREKGEADKANEVLLAARARARAAEEKKGWEKFWYWLHDKVLWFGLRSHRPAIGLALLTIFSILLFMIPGATEAVPPPPEGPTILIAPGPSPVIQRLGPLPGLSNSARPRTGWSLDCVWMSVNQSIPILDVQPKSCQASQKRVLPRMPPTYRDMAGLIRNLGWILLALLVASITGITKRIGLK